ncbi:hypothetical protein [Marinobacter sp. F3R08]|uniref:hypothetical protein n=1 Tax=Marinobacter sp. F3R08 TaxID=2841559 RepID=UPI001C0A2731|nr:hypothetical protein [Marinobacter sp. F3R08]MBU2952213.1 hypothetical protein [Marinobacter sp. F3R08]
MDKQETVARLLEQYAGNTPQKLIALTYGNGINAIPEDLSGIRIRYARIGKGLSADLSDLLNADCGIIDIPFCDAEAKVTLKRFLNSIKGDKDYLVVTEATDLLGPELVQLLDGFRPRLIVTSNRLTKCA